jgi:hypothetical protein
LRGSHLIDSKPMDLVEDIGNIDIKDPATQ